MFLLLLLDTDCSGRSLATLLVVWVVTMMVISIFLQWQYMWIVLLILTLLFLLICGYTAYNARKSHDGASIYDPRTVENVRTRRAREIRTVSGITSDNSHVQTESSAYASHLIADLPPSYASAMSVQATSVPSRTPLNVDRSDELKYEEPPPYSIVIASIDMRERNVQVSREPNTLLSTEKNIVACSSESRIRDS